jgi:hypothetical protein
VLESKISARAIWVQFLYFLKRKLCLKVTS